MLNYGVKCGIVVKIIKNNIFLVFGFNPYLNRRFQIPPKKVLPDHHILATSESESS